MIHLVKVGFRLIAVYTIILSIVGFVEVVFSFIIDRLNITKSSFEIFIAILITLLLIIIGIFLWNKSEFLANKIVGNKINENISINIDNLELFEKIAIVIIGYITLLQGLSPLIANLVMMVLNKDRDFYFKTDFLAVLNHLSLYITQVLIGTYLVLGYNGLINSIRKLRKEDSEEAENGKNNV